MIGPGLGLLDVLAATAAWGTDDTLSRALVERDPGQVVLAKSAPGAAATTVRAFATREALPRLGAAAGLMGIGATDAHHGHDH